jgi:DNA invertase Pin-like site-specific DNA recombinase
MKKAMVQIQGIFSELDKSLLVRKLRKAREKARQERGKCEGAKRYGEGSEQEQAVIRRIRAMRRNKRGNRKGMTLQQIADRLNEEGIPTKRGKKWTPGQIHMILKPKKERK